MFKHIVTKSRAVGVSHYKNTELPTKVLAKYPVTDPLLKQAQSKTRVEEAMDQLTRELNELINVEYEGQPNTPEVRAAIKADILEHLYGIHKG
jgi:hypothetical protein